MKAGHRSVAAAIAALGSIVLVADLVLAQSRDRGNLRVAEYAPGGELIFPGGTDRWIMLGSGLGGDYSEEAFDPRNPGTLTVAQMEPSAYDYLIENGRYADGTMLLLTFYAVQEKPVPALRGFVQGAALRREIHVIDRQRFPDESRAFFLYPTSDVERAPAVPLGSECVACHTEHGALDATFTQFYPVIRELGSAESLQAD
jgi:hypothetical protein